jgi:tetratricopeptide (TPR) repeat protein
MKNIIGFLFLVFMTAFSVSAFGDDTPTQKMITDEEMNFKFIVPEGFKAADLKNDSGIKYSYIRLYPPAAVFLFSEDLGITDNFNIEAYGEICKINMKAKTENFTVNKEGPLKINGYDGYFSDINTKEKNGIYGFHYFIWFFQYNGIAYQVGYYVTQYNDICQDIFDEAVRAISSFSINDVNKKSAVKFTSDILKTYRDGKKYKSDVLGYSLDLNDTPWRIDTFVYDDNKDMDVNGTYGNDGACFSIKTLMAGYEDAIPDMISSAFLDTYNINFKNDSFMSKKKIDEPGIKGYLLDFKRNIKKDYYYKFKIIIRKDRSYVLSVFTDNNDKRYIDGIFDSLTGRFVMSESFEKPGIQKLSVYDRENQTTIFNKLGIGYYYNNDKNKANLFFRKSFEYEKSDRIVLSNILTTYYEGGQYKEGLKYLNDVECGFKDDDPLIRSQTARLLYSAGKKDESYGVYRSVFSQGYPDEAYILNYLGLLVEMKKFDEADNCYSNYKDKKSDLAIEYSKLYYNLKNYDKAAKILEEYDNKTNFDVNVSYWLISNYNQSGRFEKSLEICGNLIDSGYDNLDTYYFKGECEYGLKMYKESKLSLEKALELSPGNKDITDLLNVVSGFLGEGYNSVIKDEIKAVAIPDGLIENSRKVKPAEDPSKYNGYYEYYIKGYSYEKNKDLRFTVYKKIKINDMTGVKKFNTIEIPYDPLSEEVYVNGVVIKDKNNVEVSRGNPKDYYIVDKQKNEYANFDKVINVPVSNLQPGFSVEITVTFKCSDDRSFPFKRDYLSREEFCLYSALFVSGDISDIMYRNLNCDKPVRSGNSLVWATSNPVLFKDEGYNTYVENYLDIVVMSDKNQVWENIVDGYLDKIKDKLAVEKEIADLAAKLTDGLKTNDEKTLKILSYVQENIVYKAIEFGTRSNIPNNGAAVLRNKYGDCKDQSLLAYLLLKASGINAFLALTNMYEYVDENMPSLDQFDHMILYIPEYKSGMVDLTNKEMSPSLESFIYTGRNILILDKAKARMMNFKSDIDGADCKVLIEKNIRLSTCIEVEEKIDIGNYYSPYLRYFIKSLNKDDYVNQMQGLLSSIDKDAVLTGFNVKNLNNLEENLVLELKYKFDSGIGHDEDAVLNVPAIFERFFLNPVSIADRKTPFEMLIPITIVSKNVIKTDGAYRNKLKNDAKTSDVKKFGTWKYDLKANSEGYSVDFEIYCKEGRFKNEDYQDFYNFLNESLKYLNRNMVIKK